ncbi:hypothetical protein GUJ93_ZPchr0004g38651 [Zizania palustris]|uniref:Uncharacterized protein n=1 Tax=Zizania palustris TaxID=103762 RepID=A0A8J5SJG6_ZIZPA|nr:hypothetical protein GUJ93_ZPchr0004g38651 [Zizania palustris]
MMHLKAIDDEQDGANANAGVDGHLHGDHEIKHPPRPCVQKQRTQPKTNLISVGLGPPPLASFPNLTDSHILIDGSTKEQKGGVSAVTEDGGELAEVDVPTVTRLSVVEHARHEGVHVERDGDDDGECGQ